MPAKIVQSKHHTLADWDFEDGALYRSLDAAFYVSAPTSLKFDIPDTWTSTVLCRIAGTLNLPQGEIRGWGRSNAFVHGYYTFRNQAVLGSADCLNCYQVHFDRYACTLIRVTAGVPTVVDSVAYSGSSYEWNRTRIFWYNGFTPGEVEALCVDIYREVAGEWIKQGSTMYCTFNKWKDSEINRCGIQPAGGRGHDRWYDDTEIWGPV